MDDRFFTDKCQYFEYVRVGKGAVNDMRLKNNSRKRSFALVSAVAVFLLSILACLTTINTPVKADSERVFTPLNTGFTNNWWLRFNAYSYEDVDVWNSNYYDQVVSYQGNTYLCLQVPSDNPNITSLFLSMSTLSIPLSTLETYCVSADNLLEVTFFPGDIVNNANTGILLNRYVFDYKVKYDESVFDDDDYPSYLFYLDLSDAPISTEGYGYIVVRIKTIFYNALTTLEGRPLVIPTDLDTSYYKRYWYDYGYNDGHDAGSNSGYDTGYDVGYQRGQLEASRDYHIHDLLFAIFDTPFEVLSNLFSFTIFGTTTWSIIVSLTTLLIILWILKRILT